MNTQNVTTESPRTMPDILRDLKIARVAREGLEAELDAVKEEEGRLKDELLQGMLAAGIVTGKGSGLKAVVVNRINPVVTDADALRNALGRMGVLDEYLRLDRANAAKFGLDHGLPGVERDDITFLRIEVVK